MYSNIVFDLGGVVVDYAPKDFLVDMFFYEKLEMQLYEAVFSSEEWQLLDKGDITREQANDIFLERALKKGIEFEMQAVIDEWPNMLRTRKATVTLMRLLKKKGFNLYYLSNMACDTAELLKQRDFWNLFDGGILSCDVHICKPEIEIYQKLINAYSLVPQDTIFADDTRENVAAAFQVGITGIQFKNVNTFCKMLVTFGIDI